MTSTPSHMATTAAATAPSLPSTATSTAPTTTESPACPVSGDPNELVLGDNVEEFAENVIQYLNAGGSPDELVRVLRERRAFAEVWPVDFTGDGTDEYVMGLEYEKPDPPHIFLIWALQCTNGQYQLVGRYIESPFILSAERIAVQDLTGDELPELALQWHFLASGGVCEVAMSVLSWNGEQVVDLFGSLDRPHCPGTIRIVEENLGSVPAELVISGHTSSTFMGGPPRGVVYEYVLDDGRYKVDSRTQLPSNICVHILEDAQRALDASDWDQAIELYERAAHDEERDCWPMIWESVNNRTDDARGYQSAFALFRLAAIHLYLGNQEALRDIVSELETNHVEGAPGGEFTVLANRLTSDFDAAPDADSACSQVTTLISTEFPQLEQHIGDWGYNSIHYTLETLCPF